MYPCYVACCPLASDVDYAPRSMLRLENNGTDGRMPDRYITLTATRGQRDNQKRSIRTQNAMARINIRLLGLA